MRVTTAQIFDSGTRGIGRNQFDLYKIQNQLSTGRRVLTPEDDPIGASQALVLSQTKGVSEQLLKNQDTARGKLGVVEGQLSSLGDLLQNVRERLVQAGNTTLSNSDRSYIAQELEARFSELLGIANSQDGAGNYLFSGYQGATKPFGLTVEGAEYFGDAGKRLLQVDGSRQLPTNVTGNELFQTIKNGNGTFETLTSGNILENVGEASISVSTVDSALLDVQLPTGFSEFEIRFSEDSGGYPQYQVYDVTLPDSPNPVGGLVPFVSPASIELVGSSPASLAFGIEIEDIPINGDSFRASVTKDLSSNWITEVAANGNSLTPTSNNKGTGVIDTGSVTNYQLWNAGLSDSSLWADPTNAGKIRIDFSLDSAGVSQYQIYDVSDPDSSPVAMMSAPKNYVSGQNIELSYDGTKLGAFVTITGEPVAGDTFSVSPSVNQSVFTTLRNTISMLTQGIDAQNTQTQYSNALGNNLINIDQALENVNKTRSTVGSSLRELDSLTNTGEDLQLQYDASLSELQDLDYAKAITELSQKKLQLEAAQLSFKQISQLSLFSIL
jgi:flagellar hook-associated protein 3 FlgL